MSFLGKHFRKVPQIKLHHHFEFSSSTPGDVSMKLYSNSSSSNLRMLVDRRWTPSPDELPTQIPPVGLSNERKWYLYESFADKVPRITYAHNQTRAVIHTLLFYQTRAVTHTLLFYVDQHLQTQTSHVTGLPMQNVVIGVRSVGVMTDVPVIPDFIFTNRLVSTTAHGYHCAPTPTPTTFKETARSETSLAEPPTSGGGVVGSVANPPFGGVAPFRGSALSFLCLI